MDIMPPTGPPFYTDSTVTLHHGDCLDVLRTLPAASVDSVVTDPPYGLEFMGKEWDSFKGSGARAEIRDVTFKDLGPLPDYLGGGQSTCATCGGDRYRATETGTRQRCRCDNPQFPNHRRTRSVAFGEWSAEWAEECLRVLKPGGHMLAFGGTRTFHRLACAIEDAGFEIRDSIAWMYGSGFPKSLNLVDDAGERTGWGTALKPAFEPIVVARKPLAGTVAGNVLTHGTGALNIDGCRVGTSDDLGRPASNAGDRGSLMVHDGSHGKASGADSMFRFSPETKTHGSGRWPANVILDESQAEVLDEVSGVQRDGVVASERRFAGWEKTGELEPSGSTYGGVGGASRFFYVAKADSSERVRVDGIAHPTVKPLSLMRWLVRLVTPPGGTVLEPFAGSGTTVEACILEGFRCVAIEREADYLPLIQQRIHRRRDPVAAVRGTGEDGGLFDLLDGGAA